MSDETSIEELYDGHARRVHALALRMTGDRPTADVLTQEVFVRAWRALDSFRGESSIATWLHRIAVRAILDHLRVGASWKQQFEQLDGPAASQAPSRATHNDDRIDLERAIARLPTGARTVFVMHDVEGFKYDEIASELAVSIGTVKSQLHRARRLLTENLNR